MRRAVIALVALAGCRNVLGIADQTTVESYPLAVTATGVRGATDAPPTLFLAVDGTMAQALELSDDGDFNFPKPIENAARFEVTASPGCMVTMGTGDIDGPDTMPVMVVCDGALGLADFGFTAPVETTPRLGPLQPYVSIGSYLTQETGVEPKTSYPASSVATPFYNGLQIMPMTTRVAASGHVIRVDMRADAAPGSPVIRAYTTTLDLDPTRDPNQFGYGKPMQTANGAQFGTIMDASGALLAVGVPTRGEVVVFERTGRAWRQVALLTVPGLPLAAEFGASVGVDRTTIFVGAPGAGVGGITGAVYRFAQDPALKTWSSSTPVTVPASAIRFGAAISVRTPYIAIGAPGTAAAGSVHVYMLNDLVTPTSFSHGFAGDRFGAALATSGTTLVVGAPGEDLNGVVDAGAAYAIRLLATETKLVSLSPGTGDQFGAAVAIQDITEDVAVGAPFEDSASPTDQTNNSSPSAGAVYIFRPVNPGVVEYLKAPNVATAEPTGDAFGSSLAIVGPYLAIGAPYEDSSATGVHAMAMADENAHDSGAVYVFTLSSKAMKSYLKASNTGPGDQFGTSLGFTKEALVVGAPLEDSGSIGWNGAETGGASDADRGAVYSFR